MSLPKFNLSKLKKSIRDELENTAIKAAEESIKDFVRIANEAIICDEETEQEYNHINMSYRIL